MAHFYWVTGRVLKYRVPNVTIGQAHGSPAKMRKDRRLVRHNAGQLGIDPRRIGSASVSPPWRTFTPLPSAPSSMNAYPKI
jgi:hypothetical protein